MGPQEIIKLAREAKGLSQTEVANALGVGLRQYQNIESGRFPKFKRDQIKRLEEILNESFYEEIYEEKKETTSKVTNTEKKELPAGQEEMTGMFLMLIEHLQNISASLNLTRDLTQQNNSLIQTVLLRLAQNKSGNGNDAASLFEGSLDVAKEFLKKNFARIENDKFDHAKT